MIETKNKERQKLNNTMFLEDQFFKEFAELDDKIYSGHIIRFNTLLKF